MNDPADDRETSDPADPGLRRRAALRGAAVAGFLTLAVAALRGHWDAWLAAGALASVFAGALAGGRRRNLRTGERRPAKQDRRSSMAEAVLAHIPDPVILVDQRSIVMEANAAARVFLPGLKIDHPLSFALRSPDVLDGIDAV